MVPPFRFGVGGRIGSGDQWMSWIHINDLVAAILFALGDANVFGPVNLVSPNPVRNREFAQALGKAVGRPAVLPTPLFALKLLLGETAGVVLASQRVVPEALNRAGFTFHYPEIQGALRNAVYSLAKSASHTLEHRICTPGRPRRRAGLLCSTRHSKSCCNLLCRVFGIAFGIRTPSTYSHSGS
jgi:hypothetical protein